MQGICFIQKTMYRKTSPFWNIKHLEWNYPILTIHWYSIMIHDSIYILPISYFNRKTYILGFLDMYNLLNPDNLLKLTFSANTKKNTNRIQLQFFYLTVIFNNKQYTCWYVNIFYNTLVKSFWGESLNSFNVLSSLCFIFWSARHLPC